MTTNPRRPAGSAPAPTSASTAAPGGNGASAPAATGHRGLHGVAERLGIPSALFWGFVGVLLFMVGDGVESNYLAPYLTNHGFGANGAATIISVYGIGVAVASWFSGTLSAIWSPRRVMWLGGAVWAVFEVLFLAVALPSHSYPLVLVFYGLRGLGYPLFAYSFLVWINAATPERQRGTAVGWFWFAFTGGLPTLGALLASGTIDPIGQYDTFWVSLALVVAGALIAAVGVREHIGSRPLVPEDASKTRELFSGIDITWRKPKITIGGIIRIINTAPEFGFFVFLPAFFTKTIGFSLPEYLRLATIIYATNIFANLFFGVVGDHFGWRRTITYFGGFGCAVSTLVLYYGPLAAGRQYWVAALCGAFYGFTLAGYVPLSALLPSMTDLEQKGQALAILNLGAGLAAFVGPAIVRGARGSVGVAGLIWIFACLYVVSAILSYFINDDSDPGAVSMLRRRRAAGGEAAGQGQPGAAQPVARDQAGRAYRR